jgi:hypothetical protein
MRRSIMLGLAFVAPLSAAVAQGEKDFAAYAGIVTSSLGAFAPSAPVVTSEVGPQSFAMRYGRLELEDSPLSSYGARAEFAAGRGRLGLNAGVGTCSGCEEVYHVGADWHVPLVDGALRFGLRPAASMSFFTGDDADEGGWSVALGAPIGIPLRGEGSPRVLPYLEPAFAFAGIRGEEGESGTRPMLGGGLLVASRSGRVGVQLGFQKVFIDDGDLTWGLALTFGGGPR